METNKFAKGNLVSHRASKLLGIIVDAEADNYKVKFSVLQQLIMIPPLGGQAEITHTHFTEWCYGFELQEPDSINKEIE